MLKLNVLDNLSSIFYHINPFSSSTPSQDSGKIFKHPRCKQQQSASTCNNTIAATLKNLEQALATLETANQKNSSTSSYDPVLDTFSSMQPFNLSPHSGSTAFKISCVSIDVTWNRDVNKFPHFLSQSKLEAKIDIGTTVQLSFSTLLGRIFLMNIIVSLKLMLQLTRLPALIIYPSRILVNHTRSYIPN